MLFAVKYISEGQGEGKNGLLHTQAKPSEGALKKGVKNV
jgi:hypothetical protein